MNSTFIDRWFERSKSSMIFLGLCFMLSVGLVGVGQLCGCRTATTAVDASRRFAPGLTITFPNPPTPGVVNLLNDCGAKRASEKAFVIPAYNRHDENQGYAIHQALVEGATLTGWRAPP